MTKKVTAALIAILFLVLLTGCGGKQVPGTSAEGEKKAGASDGAVVPKGNESTISVGSIAASQSSAQPLINQEYSIYSDQLKKLNKQVEFISTRSLDNIWPMMDKDEGALDFVYIPAGNFATYVTGTSRFGGSDKYIIIAGSTNSNGTVLITRPEIKSLKDLDGKKVGIANQRYVDEFQFNKLLSTVGLKTDSMGGTVKIEWDDIVPTLIENFGQGKYDAVVMYSADNYPITMSKVPGSKILTTLNPNGLFGEKAPRYWLVTKKELLKNNPELVKEVLKAHVLSTDKAIAEIDKIPAISREIYLKYFRENNIEMTAILKKNTLESYQKKWKEVEITYDPTVAYVNEVFGFLDKRGLVKGKTIDDFIQVDMLKEVLKEMGKPELK